MADESKFPPPKDMTRREVMLFEQYAGITFAQFGQMIDAGEADVPMQAQLAFLLVAVRRVKPLATFDEVIDSDWQIDATAETETPAPLPSPSVNA